MVGTTLKENFWQEVFEKCFNPNFFFLKLGFSTGSLYIFQFQAPEKKVTIFLNYIFNLKRCPLSLGNLQLIRYGVAEH